jgi:tetrathionate reductase subunit A
MTYMSALPYSLPAGQTVIDVLSDPQKLPLFIASDIMVSETSMYADYIFPDLSYLERWEFHGSHPSVPWKVENVRQPVIAIPGWPTVKVWGEEIPLCFEAVFLAIAERLNLPGFGPDGFGKGIPYVRPEDLYLKQVANIAFGEKEDGSDSVPEADDEEVRIFLEARRHLPKSVFDPEKWKAAVGQRREPVAQGDLRPQSRWTLPGLRERLQGRAGGEQVRPAHQPVSGKDRHRPSTR